MPKEFKNKINREISWLSFNERVLQEAQDASVPLLERIKFLGIYSSNLDEFFRVRVGTMKRLEKAGIKAKSLMGETPTEVLNEIQKVVIKQRKKFDSLFPKVKNELEKENIFIINEKQLSAEQEAFVQIYFEEEVRPTLVPLMLDTLPTFPYLNNQVIYLAIYLSKNRKPEAKTYALIELPTDVLPRFVVLPGIARKKYIIMLDDIIRYGLKDIFAIFDYDNFAAYTVKLTRDAELDIEDDVTKSIFEKISKSVKQRQWGQPVRFVYDHEMPPDLLDYIIKKNDLRNFDNIIPGGRYHNAKDFMSFPNVGSTRLGQKRYSFALSLPVVSSCHRSLA
jgi:polyphosphate kinase